MRVSDFQDIAKLWHHEKNAVAPVDVLANDKTTFWWKCAYRHTWNASPHKLCIEGRPCPYCFKMKNAEHKSLGALFPELAKEWDCELNEVSPYELTRGTPGKVWWKCKKNHSWEMSVCSRTSTNQLGCPMCNESKGEKMVGRWLEAAAIEFERQKWWPECKDRLPLRFDFYVPGLNLAIEYDGPQHFPEHVELFKWAQKENPEITWKHDQIKNEYCANAGRHLLRIPFNHTDKLGLLRSAIEALKKQKDGPNGSSV